MQKKTDLGQQVQIAAVGVNCCNAINAINFHGSAPNSASGLKWFGTIGTRITMHSILRANHANFSTRNYRLREFSSSS